MMFYLSSTENRVFAISTIGMRRDFLFRDIIEIPRRFALSG